MQDLLETDRQRADKYEKMYAEALETIQMMKLEKPERKVLKLQRLQLGFDFLFMRC